MSLNTPTPALFPLADVAERLSVSKKTVSRWVESGELRAHKLGAQWRISESDLATFLIQRRR
ncbi:MAG: helix-turn-helix domain-containing protein [Caulobacter sp.]|nr:helix-turn-helix domain-containing protein [Caulobacter sp.]